MPSRIPREQLPAQPQPPQPGERNRVHEDAALRTQGTPGSAPPPPGGTPAHVATEPTTEGATPGVDAPADG